MIEKLKKEGREQFDRLQANLTSVISATDEELAAQLEARNSFAEMFGGGEPLDAEGWRNESRRLQDKMDRQGREDYAEEYAQAWLKNFTG